MTTAASGSVSSPSERKLSAVLAGIFGALAAALSLWAAFLVAALGGDTAVILLHAGGYRPATFTIEKLVFLPGGGTSGRVRGTTTRSADKYWAEGKVGGAAERFSFLGAYVQGIPQSQEEFERQLSVGRQLPVLYNPDLPQTAEVRVLYPKEQFREFWQQRWRNIFLAGYLPMGSALALCALCCLVAGRWWTLKLAVFWSVPVAVLGWLPGALKMLRD